MTSASGHPTPGGWKKANRWAGHLVFGLPAVLAVPALMATLARFGVWQTATAALPAALWACVPLLLWVRYTRRAPRTGAGAAAWMTVAVIGLSMLLLSPIWFWSGPCLFVVASEILRVTAGPLMSRALAGLRPKRQSPLGGRAACGRLVGVGRSPEVAER